MRKIIAAPLIGLLTCCAPLAAEPLLLGGSAKHLEVNNRILANVNGKPITLYDIVKRMDMIFYKQFPEYAESAEARYQFYSMNWKQILKDLIEKELILADAEEIKIPVSSGDVRQEMESLFGPNIIETLDKIGLSFSEAMEIVEKDIIMRRTLYVRVNSKAIRAVTPQTIKKAYEEWAADNAIPPEWRYRVISFRDEDEARAAETAAAAYRLLKEEQVPLDALKEKVPAGAKVNVSGELCHSEKEVSPRYKEVLVTLEPESFSRPGAFASRATGAKVYRIFYLKEKSGGRVPEFSEVEGKLKNGLIEKAIAKESSAYLKRLKEHFHFDDSEIEARISENFQPFVLN